MQLARDEDDQDCIHLTASRVRLLDLGLGPMGLNFQQLPLDALRLQVIAAAKKPEPNCFHNNSLMKTTTRVCEALLWILLALIASLAQTLFGGQLMRPRPLPLNWLLVRCLSITINLFCAD